MYSKSRLIPSALPFTLLLFSCVIAQISLVSVPADLSSNFDPGSISLQVNYDNKAEFGFADGAQFSPQQTSKTPDFALGDASGVNTAISFLLVMLDTTTDSRVLHFLQPDFHSNGDETQIASTTKPAFAYNGPGTLGETGSRQYSFLLYQQFGTFQSTSIPSVGQTVDMQKFQSDNGLEDALAGVVMVVDLTSASSSAPQQLTTLVASSSIPPLTISSSSASAMLISSTPQITAAAVSTIVSAAATSISSIAIQSTPTALSNGSVTALPSFSSSSTANAISQTKTPGTFATVAASSILASSSSTLPTPTIATASSKSGCSAHDLPVGLISFLMIFISAGLS